MTAYKPVVLCILDGWGLSDLKTGNAPLLAHTPNFDVMMADYPHAKLTTHGTAVGLPSGQMGNSEVGHTNIGAGRVVPMDLGVIDLAIEEGTFAKNPSLLAFISTLSANCKTAHLFGVLSDGGVHGHISHMKAAIRAITELGVPVVVHAITDGRDVAPASAISYIADLQTCLPEGSSIGTVTGRYWALDRDNRWERVSRAYEAVIFAHGALAASAQEAVEQSYRADVLDEFVAPTIMPNYHGVAEGDGFFCLNFRADRTREILSALLDPAFNSFDTGARPKFGPVLGMVDYSKSHDGFMQTVYPKPVLHNTLGEWVAKQGKTQSRIAETEKYPHVTFFLNGGKETVEPGEARYMAASPKVATYDLQPEMSAPEVAAHLCGAISQGYDLIVANFANPDMVGHTGDLAAAIAACEAVDRALGQVQRALLAIGGAMIVTADHGNCETMINPATGDAHTAHTMNLVPVILVNGPKTARMRDGSLTDLAPTLLTLIGLTQPMEMTGESLLI
jgi:2,3-bisphosphoglycerate-independent phosphoglycerate mutase